MINLLLSKYKAYIYLAALASICAVSFGAGVGFNKLTSDRFISNLKLKHQEEIYDREQTLMEVERQANAELAERQKQIDSANTQFAEEMKNAKIQFDLLTADYRADKRVLTSKVKGCMSTTKTDNSGTVTTETRAELDSEVAADIIGVGGRCDDITKQLNALIDAVK